MKQEYRIGDLVWDELCQQKGWVIPEGGNFPRARMLMDWVVPDEVDNRWGADFSCVPQAFWKAMQMAGRQVTMTELAAAKYLVNRGKMTDPVRYCQVLDRFVPEFQVEAWFASRPGNLREVTDALREMDYRIAVICLDEPKHAMAIHISQDEVLVWDNGLMFYDAMPWDGGGILQVYGVKEDG